MKPNQKKDKFEENACEFKNEEECEEELEEDGVDINEAEKKHFEEGQEGEIDEDE